MASPVRQQHPFWDLVPLEAVAGVVLAAVAVARPLPGADDWVTGRLLQAVAVRTPPQSVIAVELDAEIIRSGACPSSLSRVLAEGEARGAVILPAADALCPISPLAAGPPRAILPEAAVRRSSEGVPIGFSASAFDDRLEQVVDAPPAPWVAPRPWPAVPAVKLSDLAAHRVDPRTMANRLVVVGVHEPTSPAGRRQGPAASRVAGALAATIEDHPRRQMDRWMAGLLAGVMGALLALGLRSRRRRWLRWLGCGSAGAALVAAATLGALGPGRLVPLPSLLLGLAAFGLVARLPSALAARRGRREALHMLARIEGMGSEDVYTLPDQVFWARLANRVADAHPADSVLLAELPPYSWHIVVHPNEDLTDAVIRERRRDIRRTPYTDGESGQRRIKIVPDYLIMKDAPTVFLPLEASGETEGYVFLIGEPAAQAYRQLPGRTERLATDLAKLIRRRRLERVRADEWRRPGGVLIENPGQQAAQLVEGTRAAVGKLEQLGQVALAAPVGMLYADAFGHVRLLGASVARWLEQVGLEVPTASEAQLLAPGALPLSKVLEAVGHESGSPAPLPDELTEEERVFEMRPPDGRGPERGLLFKIRRLSAKDTPYVVASLVEIPREQAMQRDNVEALPERGDPLSVFSLAQLLVDVVDSAKRRSEGSIRLQTPRVLAHVLGHRQELSRTLIAFLTEAAGRAGSGSGPTLTIQEEPHRVHLSLLDVKLGVPPAAVKRTLLAPSMPPPGLGPLGALARAVENSHGTVELRHEEGWGAQIVTSFVRARPRVEPEPSAEIINIPKAPAVPKG